MFVVAVLAVSHFVMAEEPQGSVKVSGADIYMSARQAQGSNLLDPIRFEDIEIGGNLHKRAMRNFDRMESSRYQPSRFFVTTISKYPWPGDIEGRSLMALILLSRATHREARYLPEIMKQLPGHLNEKGYFGPVYESVADEQQLSSHGWVLRGLCEYCVWKGDRQVLEMIEAMVDNLALPLAEFYKIYPIDPSKRKHVGEKLGIVMDEQSRWRLSSDIGCAFVFLDGLTHAYILLKDEKLKILIDKMIARFLEMDLVEIKAQAHSTLTALRSILRHYEQTGDAKLFKAVQDRYHLYRNVAMTETYANYGWFGRPKWTEPCAIIDSFMLAVSLWRHSGRSEYLEDAHHIYFNGMGRGQRSNGGYGTDSCAGANDPFLKLDNPKHPEAWWCCTMRGGEGLARAIEYTYFSNQDTIVIPFYHNNKATIRFGDRSITFKETTSYPYGGTVRLEVLETSLDMNPKIKFFVPTWCSDLKVKHNGKPVRIAMEGQFAVVNETLAAKDTLELNASLVLRCMDTINRNSIAGYHSFRYGPLILGHAGDNEIKLGKNTELIPLGGGWFKVKNSGVILSPINDLINLEMSEGESFCRQVLFTKS